MKLNRIGWGKTGIYTDEKGNITSSDEKVIGICLKCDKPECDNKKTG